MNGILIINKPKGKTSFDIVREIRKKYHIKKVGHIGTLDPLATGVLPILIGNATRLSDYLMDHHKEYIAILKLGEKTETGDIEGKVIEQKKYIINEEKVIKVLNQFLGESFQIPPMYSAIKINGEKLYNLARKGETVERKSRKIIIDNIELISINKDEIKFKVKCSKGTYIRVLCEDIAEKLETVGYMKELTRISVGDFKIEKENEFIKLEDILKTEKITLKLEEKDKLLNGVKILKKGYKNNLYNIYIDKQYIGIGEIKDEYLKRKIIIEE